MCREVRCHRAFLDESAERLLEMARALPANFRMVIYGLAKTPAQALRTRAMGSMPLSGIR